MYITISVESFLLVIACFVIGYLVVKLLIKGD